MIHQIEFDPEKDRINRARRDLSLAEAAELLANWHDLKLDASADYGEERWTATGMIRGKVHVCIYTMRGQWTRIISLRKAMRAEVDGYYEAKGRRV